ncbi:MULTISPECIES: 2-dehydropantoate 2-reductase [unclassified Acidovorax]|uniref:2-dehydropantoate 2-reductase n=1 Tax=unclassified Acidovorax TaxID=2684926 RepID=UPI0006FBCFF3|nr:MULTISPECIES: 2-dehydropantoate 2-reductase [unclassified Acidovorax]KRB34679.1 2-dehydropantoate 2-reductase [Acidovorax sp. Root70]PUA97282.1 2-dehydropantoate 2-reductase [Acidovorax sp. 107]
MLESPPRLASDLAAPNLQTVCIVGAGAIGSLIGASIAATGNLRVSALARGDNLTALQTSGWRMEREDGSNVQAPANASDRAEDLGPQDLVVIAVKGPALAAVAASIRPLIGPHTVVLPAMNGVPWWFCQGLPGFESGLPRIDPHGEIAASIPFANVLGAVVHASSRMRGPGMVKHVKGKHLIIGEPQGGSSPRALAVGELLQAAGFEVTVSDDIRHDIWFKLWGNLTMNPLSAVTGATVDRILSDAQVRAFCSAAMNEVAAVGEKIRSPIDQSPEDRHRITEKLGAFKTSMLQDAEAGRTLELDAIVGAVRDIAQRVQVPTPNVDALFGICRLFAQTKGLYPNE